jgi:hypothetical protein
MFTPKAMQQMVCSIDAYCSCCCCCSLAAALYGLQGSQICVEAEVICCCLSSAACASAVAVLLLQRLMGCEGVELVFTPAAIQEVAAMAEQINKEVENIGARRLHTVLERLVEDISFEAPDKVAAATAAAGEGSREQAAAAAGTEEGQYCYRHVIDKDDVQQKLADLVKKQDLGKYIL